ncbi:MAG TPA: molybdopterin cofactor-binding domain-containing protein, partial [Rhodanobacteraceae bacterium]|nr:molybdopterin cofactor-binding domain-containing protein [Rhodanobacteraceae bacterium]
MSRVHDASRRRFLKVFGTATGALVVGLPALAWTPDELLGRNLYQLGAYVRIEPDGTTVVGARDPEIGQGIRTAEARIIAEELDADWTRVIVEPLDLGVTNANGEPHWTYGHQMASGSTSVPAAWNDLRSVGAAARELLLRAAAAQWKTGVATLRTAHGMVIAANGRKLGYGELAEAASKLKPAGAPPRLKTAAQYVLVGQDAGDVDARDIVTGRQHFAVDEWFGDTLAAAIVHCPWPGGTLAHLDDAAALKMKGVEKVLTIPAPDPARPLGTQQLAAAVAVLAHDTWTALQAIAKLDVRWQPGARPAQGDDALAAAAATAFQGDPAKAVRTDGDFAETSKRAPHRFKADYRFATIAHADLEPPNARVTVDN